MRLKTEVIDYFKKMAEGVGMPYQSLINLYLRDYVTSHRELKMQWS
jgi:predicted DNA binding CopG/RHH family protein